MKDSDSSSPGFHSVPRPSDPARPIAREPFPVHLLPAPIANMVEAVAQSRCVAADVPAAVALAASASAVGLSRVLYDAYADWVEPLVIWLVVVIRSGARKSVVLEDLFHPHRVRQERYCELYDHMLREYETAVSNWKQQQRHNKSPEALPKPETPRLEHVYTSDVTPEGVVEILRTTPKGVLVHPDELAHFFGGFGAYSGKAERDRSFYLALFNANQYKADRKGSGTTFLSRAAASIVGGIQPRILSRCFDSDAYASGLASRFLLIDAPPQVKQYRSGPTPREKAEYANFIEALFSLEMEPIVGDGEPAYRPQHVHLSEEARVLLRDFVPDWSEQSLLETASVEAAMSKLEGYALRFALLHRCWREVMEEEKDGEISREDLEFGITIAKWFRGRAVAIYESLRTDEETATASQLDAWVAVIRSRFGGAVTAREWQKMNTRRTAEEASAELEQLVAAGVAIWRKRPSGSKGGRPTEECALLDPDGVPPGDPDDVSGCGLRGAPGDAHDADGTEAPAAGGPDTNLRSGRNPEPPSRATAGSDALRLLRCREDIGQAVERGGAERSAPRNPQPETLGSGPQRPHRGGACLRPQPESPRRDGVASMGARSLLAEVAA